MKFTTLEVLAGWFVFAISLSVYIFTLEPANSLWDCSEFIACAYRLQVSHSPGAPLFIMIGRLFSLLAGNSVEKVALMVNLFSAVASAFTIMFLFWSMMMLAKKIISSDGNPDRKQQILMLAAGITGSLSFAFTDSFWFSAVEAEVYAFSSFLTALVFWAILKWEKQEVPVYASRWLIFIAFILSISIGVHLLNLLAIPAIVFVILSKNKTINRKVILYSLMLAMAVLGIILYVFIPGIAKIASVLDLFCVNSLKLPLNTGLYLTFFFMGIILVIALTKAIRNNNLVRQTAVLSLMFMLIGYTCYLSVLFRSQVNISIDMNNPDNPFGLCDFLNREHYGSRPLFYGPYYNAPITGVKNRTTNIYENGRYIKTDLNPKYTYDKRFMTIFPRLIDNSENYTEAYKYWAKIKGEKIRAVHNGQSETIVKPVFSENLRYFLRYQIGYMYWRYFFWNFVGRQDDVQGTGNAFHGNWISGIGFIDRLRLGNQTNLPPSLSENKARNTYFFIPLLFGICGAVWHFQKDRKGFTTILLLFLFTGMAISVYLNEIPVTPRERDYVYAGSFYAFAIWIGMGVMAVFSFLKKYLSVIPSMMVSVSAGIIVPVLLLSQNYDDHNRSNRFAGRDFGYDYVNSCRKNSILFTNGDNDTYPLWYIQEVESVRPDVRVVLYPYLGASWYIDQMRNDINEAERLQVSLSSDKFYNGKRSVVHVVNRIDSFVELKDAIDFINSDNPQTKLMRNDSNYQDYIPARNLKITIDKNALRKSGIFSEKEIEKTGDSMVFTIQKNYLIRSELLLLDIIAQNNWERPLCFLSPVELKNLGLDKYLVKEGFTYRLVPYPANQSTSIYGFPMDTAFTYKLLMEKFKWGNLNDPAVYADQTIRRQLQVLGVRRTFAQLADNLINSGETDKAENVIDKCMKIMPLTLNPDDYFISKLISQYFETGNQDKGMEKMNEYATILTNELDYFKSLEKKIKNTGKEDYGNYLYFLNELLNIADKYLVTEFKNKYAGKFKMYYDDLMKITN
ncbi:MAG: DUF2723 domain-containing protein [Bacteroidales bacterium]|nr:DUF2723 domain-containing protein [Bacteroidales bacterium]